MSTKLLVAGIALTFLALRSEPKLTQPAVAAKAEAADAASSVSSVHRSFGRVGSGIEFVVAQAVSESLATTEQTLRMLEPHVANAEADTAKAAQKLTREIAFAVSQAQEELKKHRSFAAMDHAMHAANQADDLKRLLIERR